MRHRIGYGGPREYRHGQHFPGGRRNNGGLTEFERLIHLIASMQVLFGSRRGMIMFPLLLVGVMIGGWFLYRQYYSPDTALERAHQMWDSNDTKQQMKAIAQYRILLQKKDPIEKGRNWLMDDRDTLYRRIIQHDVNFSGDEIKAAEWCLKAWDEGIRDLRFPDETVEKFWERTTASSRQKNINRNRRGESNSDPPLELEPQSNRSSRSYFPTAPVISKSSIFFNSSSSRISVSTFNRSLRSTMIF